MNKKQINIKASNAVLLNYEDNIIIAIDNMKANQHLENFDIAFSYSPSAKQPNAFSHKR